MYKKIKFRVSLLSIIATLFISSLTFANEPLEIPHFSSPPTRIIVLEFSLLDNLIALGIKPIGIASSAGYEGGNPPYLRDATKGIPDVGTRQHPSLEAIMALKPDLIIADPVFQANIESQLHAIAPTIMLDGILGTPEQQIKNLQALAKITNTEPRVSDLEKRYYDLFKKAQSLGATNPGTSLIGYVDNKGVFQALTKNAIATEILNDLHQPNLNTAYRKSQSVAMGASAIYAKNPDSIIILLSDGDKSPYEKLTQNPLWTSINAVKNNKIYFMDRDVWAKTHGIQALEIMLNEAISTGFLENK